MIEIIFGIGIIIFGWGLGCALAGKPDKSKNIKCGIENR